MSETALIIRDDAALKVSFSDAAKALKESALASGALVGKVTSAEEQAAAFQAQAELDSLVKTVEKARKACKEPVITFGRRIDQAAKDFVDEPTKELTRISGMIGSFQQLEQEKERRATQATNETLTTLEREKAAALAQAKSHDELDAINEHYGNKIAEAQGEIYQAPRIEGQRITPDYEIIVTDIHLLYRHHPNCVELTPRMSEIKNLLKGGTTPKGVNAKPIVKAGVTGRRAAAIEV